MALKMQKVTPPPELQAIIATIGRASGHSMLAGIHVRHLEARIYGGPEWAALAPRPEPNRINTKQTVGEEQGITVVRTEYQQAFIADIPPEYQTTGAPTDFAVLVRAGIEAHYRVDDELAADKERRHAFAKVNAIMVTWPYWREWAQSSLSRMGLVGETAAFVHMVKAIHMAGLYDIEKFEREFNASMAVAPAAPTDLPAG